MTAANRSVLPPLHLLLALAVMAVWGTNFVVIKLALAHLPPLTLAALRFAFAFLPLALFVPRPAVPWRNLATYGVLIGAGQFGLLFTAMRADITPGLASLVVQTQAFFTIALSMRLTGERVAPFQIAALVLAAGGLGIIALHTDGSATPLGLALVLGAALCWALGNMTSRAAGPVNMLAYVVWADGATWAAVAWQAVGNTMFGYGAWGWLLGRYPAASVAPLSLLVPVFGLGASALWMGEALPGWKLTAFALVMAGLALGILWPRLAARFLAGSKPA